MGIPFITVGTPGLPGEEQPSVQQLESQLIGNRAITFQVNNIPPPAAAYISTDDTLQVTVANSLAGQSIIIVGQILLPDGRLQPNQWTVAPGASRAFQNWFFPLGEGYLMNITVAPTANPTRRGQTWVQAGLRRGGSVGGSLVQTLICDYVDSLSGGSWPGGILHNSLEGRGYLNGLHPANPAAGQPCVITVPTNAHWIPLSINASLTTTATAGNRLCVLYIQDQTTAMVFEDYLELTVAPSSGGTFQWSRLLGTNQTTMVQAAVCSRSLSDIRLGPGFTINIFIGTMAAGDTLHDISILVEEFLSP